MIFWNIVFILVLVALNGFFVAVEFSAVSARRARLDLLAEPHSRAGRFVRGWIENTAARDRLIAATQLGITLVSLALGAVGENTFEALLEPYFHEAALPPALAFINTILPILPLIISLLIVTSLHVVLGEQVPKVAVLRAPEKFALTAAPFMQFFIAVFKWFVNALDWATRAILGLFGLPATTAHTLVFSQEEFKQMVAGPEMEGVVEQPERDMLSAVIDFGELIVRQVMVPRTEIIALEGSAGLPEIIETINENSITKFPVYEENIDQVVGVLHVRDVLLALSKDQPQPPTARDLAREAIFVPETINVNDLLFQFRQRRQHLAIVLDEYGGTAGVVTLEDLVEEIVGEFRDPFDASLPEIQTMPDGTVMIDGLALMEEVNEHLGLQLYDPHYDTIAGYVLGKLEHIPQAGDVVDDPENKIRLKVTAMDRLRIARVQLSRLEP